MIYTIRGVPCSRPGACPVVLSWWLVMLMVLAPPPRELPTARHTHVHPRGVPSLRPLRILGGWGWTLGVRATQWETLKSGLIRQNCIPAGFKDESLSPLIFIFYALAFLPYSRYLCYCLLVLLLAVHVKCVNYTKQYMYKCNANKKLKNLSVEPPKPHSCAH